MGKEGRRFGLGTWILVGMAVGALLGWVAGPRIAVVQPVGDAFIRLLIMAAVPLVFFNLMAGLTTLTDVRALGRLAGKTVSFFFLTTAFAVGLGIAAMLVLAPGVGMSFQGSGTTEVVVAPSVVEILLDLIPVNIFAAFAEGNVTQLVIDTVVAAKVARKTVGRPPDVVA
jgi:Na+/H+-dicarboxylate symporter